MKYPPFVSSVPTQANVKPRRHTQADQERLARIVHEAWLRAGHYVDVWTKETANAIEIKSETFNGLPRGRG